MSSDQRERLSCEKGHDVVFGLGGTIAKAVNQLREEKKRQDVAVPSDQCSQCKEDGERKSHAHQKKGRHH